MKLHDYIAANSGVFIIGATLVLLAIFFGWKYGKSVYAGNLKKDLNWFWEQFDDNRGCECARHYWSSGDSVIKKYGILPDGCSNRGEYCDAAIESLCRYIDHQKEKFASTKVSSPSLAEQIKVEHEKRLAHFEEDLTALCYELGQLKDEKIILTK